MKSIADTLYLHLNKEVKKGLILSDLDGTILNTSLVLSHYGYLIQNNIVSDDGSFSAWQMDKKNDNLITDCAMSYQRAINGLNLKDLKIYSFISEFVKEKSNFNNEILDFLITKKIEGYNITILTGSADYLAYELADLFNFDCIATIYKRDFNDRLNGEVVGMFSQVQKSNYIKGNIDLHLYNDIIGIGDTMSDYGIFEHCNYNILVNPTKETLEGLITKIKIDRIVKG
jgi:phosphoserine phosphatase